MPQIRAVMSGTSSKARPRKKASNKRGGSKIVESHVFHAIAAQANVQPAFALDAGQGLDADRASLCQGRIGLAMTFESGSAIRVLAGRQTIARGSGIRRA